MLYSNIFNSIDLFQLLLLLFSHIFSHSQRHLTLQFIVSWTSYEEHYFLCFFKHTHNTREETPRATRRTSWVGQSVQLLVSITSRGAKERQREKEIAYNLARVDCIGKTDIHMVWYNMVLCCTICLKCCKNEIWRVNIKFHQSFVQWTTKHVPEECERRA